ncbi:MAG: futalosine hydrolase [Phycisphaerales bacterium]|nr:MAG: futalosine hydrolase [Phycisphaerales bacterium]
MQPRRLAPFTDNAPVLILVAAEIEARAVRDALPPGTTTPAPAPGSTAPATGTTATNTPGSTGSPPWRVHTINDRFHLLITGVGKANAAGALAYALRADAYAAVVNTGVCGALPGSNLEPGACILATSSVFADEGMRTRDGFDDIASMGFPPVEGAGVGFPAHGPLAAALAPCAEAHGPIACVSTCSGTDALALDIVARTHAIGEAMEGAAAGVVCARLGVPFAEVRVVSNSTGERATQRWDMPRALARLGALVGAW